MKRNSLLVGFLITISVAILIRVFVFDVISVSNEVLLPQFYPGDFLLVSKLSKSSEGSWALVKDYPQPSVYSIRQLVTRQNNYNKGWIILDPQIADNENPTEKRSLISDKKIVGRVIMVLWSLPCKPQMMASGVCPDKGSRFFKTVP